MAYSIANWKNANKETFKIPKVLNDEDESISPSLPAPFTSQVTARLIYDTFVQSKIIESSQENTSVLVSVFSSLFGTNNKEKADPLKSDQSFFSRNEECLSTTIEVHSIPQQIHTMVRFHYASFVRFANRIQISKSLSRSIHYDYRESCGILGIGMFGDFRCGGREKQGAVNIGLTSDRKGLLKYFNDYTKIDKTQITKTLSLAHIRIATVGNDCRCVSWGFDYGIVRIYRRVAPHSQKGTPSEFQWKLVAVVTPSPDLSTNNFNLVVTDLSPIIIDENTALLCISRVGCLVQIVHVPLSCWKSDLSKSMGRVLRINVYGQSVPNCGSILVNHEVLSLDTFRSDDNSKAFILATAGSSRNNPTSSVSFWRVEINQINKSLSYSIRMNFLSVTQLMPFGPSIGTAINNCSQSDKTSNESNESMPSIVHVDSPILQISFSPLDNNVDHHTQYLAVLDYHGGVTLISCESLTKFLIPDTGAPDKEPFDQPKVEVTRQKFLQKTTHMSKISPMNTKNIGANKIVQISWASFHAKSQNIKQSSSIHRSLSIITVSEMGVIQIIDFSKSSGKSDNDFRYSPRFPLENEGQSNKSIILLNSFNNTPSPNPTINYIHMNGIIGSLTSDLHLALCYIEKVDPPSIVQHLIRSRKLQEALKLSIQYNIETDACYKAIWESEVKSSSSLSDCVVNTLFKIKDNDYVIDVALNVKKIIETASFCSKSLESLFYESISRAELNLKKDLDTNDAAALDHSLVTLRALLNRLQTFLLLCSIWNIPFDAKIFFSMFLDVPLNEIAQECALKGDTDSLLVLFARHGNELITTRMHLLELFPPSLSAHLYQFLLPVPNTNGKCNSIHMFFVDDGNGGRALVTYPELNRILQKSFPHKSNDAYSKLSNVIPPFEEITSDKCIESFLSTADWYLRKAIEIHTLTEDFKLTLDICELGIERLNILKTDQEIMESPDVINAMNSLHSLRSLCFHIFRFMNDGIFTDKYKNVSITQLLTMGIKELTEMILGTHTSSSEVLSRYEHHYKPMIIDSYSMNTLKINIESSQENYDSLEVISKDAKLQMRDSIISYASNRLYASKDNPESFINSLAVCLIFANLSRTTLSQKTRVIDDIEAQITFVLDCAYVGNCSVTAAIAPQKYVEMLWKFYECIPIRQSGLKNNFDSINKIQSSADRMRSHIIAVEILSYYCPPPCLAKLLATEEKTPPENGNANKYSQLGCEFFASMCDGFCNLIIREGNKFSSEKKTFILNFLSDTCELRKNVFPDLPAELMIQMQVFPSLLKHQDFDAVKDILQFITSGSSNISLEMDDERTKSVVFGFIQELYNRSIYAEVDVIGFGQSNDLQVAKSCEDFFCSLYPQWKNDFGVERKILETYEFIRSLNCHSINLSTLRNTPALDTIERILSTSPTIIIVETDWRNINYASSMNREFLHYLSTCNNSSIVHVDEDHKLCTGEFNIVLPGSNVLKIAKMLGVSAHLDLIFLRNRMIHHAIKAGYYSAAAILCFSLIMSNNMNNLNETVANSEKNKAISLELMLNISTLVDKDEFLDIHIKKELCSNFLSYCKSKILTAQEFTYFSAILHCFNSLELNTTPPENNDYMNCTVVNNQELKKETKASFSDSLSSEGMKSPEKADFLVFKAAGMFAKRAKSIADQAQRQQLTAESLSASATGIRIHEVNRVSYLIQFRKQLDSIRLLHLNENLMLDEFILKKDSLVIPLARQVLDECVIQCVKIRYPNCASNDHIQTPITSIETENLIQFGIALLLDINDKEQKQMIAKEMGEKLEEKSAISLQLLSDQIPATPVVPDEDIVRKLCAYGYGIQGARRSAIKTNNTSFNAALEWAISHFKDKDFNSPIIPPKVDDSLNGGFIDQKLIHLMRLSLHATSHLPQKGKTTTNNEELKALPSRGMNKNEASNANRLLGDNALKNDGKHKSRQTTTVIRKQTKHAQKTNESIISKKELPAISGSTENFNVNKTNSNSLIKVPSIGEPTKAISSKYGQTPNLEGLDTNPSSHNAQSKARTHTDQIISDLSNSNKKKTNDYLLTKAAPSLGTVIANPSISHAKQQPGTLRAKNNSLLQNLSSSNQEKPRPTTKPVLTFSRESEKRKSNSKSFGLGKKESLSTNISSSLKVAKDTTSTTSLNQNLKNTSTKTNLSNTSSSVEQVESCASSEISRNVHEIRTKTALSMHNSSLTERASIHGSVRSKSNSLKNIPSIEQRRKLRAQGQQLITTKRETKNLDPVERKRYLEEGRRLLEGMRRARKSEITAQKNEVDRSTNIKTNANRDTEILPPVSKTPNLPVNVDKIDKKEEKVSTFFNSGDSSDEFDEPGDGWDFDDF